LGSFAIFAAIRRVSSRVSNLAAERAIAGNVSSTATPHHHEHHVPIHNAIYLDGKKIAGVYFQPRVEGKSY
jgi:uncharacterized protein involved in high-affinity Fe2+ transport